MNKENTLLSDWLSFDHFGFVLSCKKLSVVLCPLCWLRASGHRHANGGQNHDSWSQYQEVFYRHVRSGPTAHLWGILQQNDEAAAGRQVCLRRPHRHLRRVDAEAPGPRHFCALILNEALRLLLWRDESKFIRFTFETFQMRRCNYRKAIKICKRSFLDPDQTDLSKHTWSVWDVLDYTIHCRKSQWRMKPFIDKLLLQWFYSFSIVPALDNVMGDTCSDILYKII